MKLRILVALNFLFTINCYSQFSVKKPEFLPYKGIPIEMTIGDFDGNGHKDIAYISEGSIVLSVIYFESDNTSTEVEIYNSTGTTSAVGLSSGDINKDGKTDIVLVDNGLASTEKIFVFLSNGRTFNQNKLQTPLPFTLSKKVKLVDWDNDSNLDLIAICDDLPLQFYKGNGLGQFNRQQISSIGAGTDMEIAYLNADNQLDVVISNQNKVSIFLSSGATFVKSDFTFSVFVTEIAIGDLSEDGLKDILLITINDPNESLVSLVNSGLGSFTKTVISSTVPFYRGLEIGDYNGDGRNDIVAGEFTNEEATKILQSTGPLTYIDDPIKKNYSSLIFSLKLEDLDNDSKPEIIALSAGRRIDIFKLDINQDYELHNTIITGFHANQGQVGDLNNDGYLDLVTSSPSNYAIAIHYGLPNLSFNKPIYFSASGPLTAVALFDINNDTFLDILYSSAYTSQSTSGILKSNGIGGFLAPETFSPSFSGVNLILDDLNGDNLIDIIFSNAYLEAQAGGGYVFRSFNSPIGIADFTVADVNNDTFKDIIITDYVYIVYFLNDGLGNFSTYSTLKDTGSSYKVSVADLNSDLLPDFIVPKDNSIVSIYYAQTGGGYLETNLSTSDFRPFASVVGDFNGDNLDDFAVGHDSGKLDFFIRKENNQFQRSSVEANGSVYLVGTDLNNDSKKDIISYNLNGNPISIIINDTVIEPTQSPSSIEVNDRTNVSAKIDYIKGNGNGRLLTIRELGVLATPPTDGIFYSANAVYEIGAEIGTKNFVVYRGSDQIVSLTGLKTNTEYIVTAYEYQTNDVNTVINYMAVGTELQFKTKNTQTITLTDIGNKTIGDAAITLSFNASSQLVVEATIISGDVTLSGTILTLNGEGPVKLLFSQVGNDNYMPAPDIEVNFCINPIQPIVTITSSGPGQIMLTSSSETNNIWLRNGESINNATNKTYEPIEDGMYAVKVDYTGCFSTSLPTAHIITSIEDSVQAISIHPNPTEGNVIIRLPSSNVSVTRLILIDANGKSIDLNFIQNQSSIYFDISTKPKGLYVALVQTKEKLMLLKIIKK